MADTQPGYLNFYVFMISAKENSQLKIFHYYEAFSLGAWSWSVFF